MTIRIPLIERPPDRRPPGRRGAAGSRPEGPAGAGPHRPRPPRRKRPGAVDRLITGGTIAALATLAAMPAGYWWREQLRWGPAADGHATDAALAGMLLGLLVLYPVAALLFALARPRRRPQPRPAAGTRPVQRAESERRSAGAAAPAWSGESGRARRFFAVFRPGRATHTWLRAPSPAGTTPRSVRRQAMGCALRVSIASIA